MPSHEKIGRYRILEKIGAGGMGEVYLAEDARLRRKIALKVLPENIAADKDRLLRFEREAFAASALNHPNILTIYEFGADGNVHFLALEFIKGETLRQKIQNLSLTETLNIAVQIASALEAAHDAGIIHRDIKPENVMIREDGYVKVLDFGLAKLSEPPAGWLNANEEAETKIQTQAGMIMGTAAYMSPEQAGGKTVDARTDIFSFGVVLYEMLTRRQPFTGETISHTIVAILEKAPPPLTQFVKDYPSEIERIIFKTLAKNKDERYQSAKDLLLDLKALQKRLEFEGEFGVSPVEGVSPSVKTAQTETKNAEAKTQVLEAAQTTAEKPPTSETPNTKRSLLLGLIIFLLTVVGLGGYWFFGNRSAKQIESIAVLPFINESGNADVEYLSDGMTETLISSLSQLPQLNVKARSSVFRYKGKEISPQTIGRELNVQAVLLGRVIQRGEQLKLNLELVDARTENIIWSGQYNRKQADLISLQNEIARDVSDKLSDKLKTKFSGADEQSLTKNYTANAEAYQFYLRGRFYWNKRTGEGLKKSIEYFNQAIEKDPNYALAYAGLADAYLLFPVYSIGTPQDSYPKAKASAKKALLIDETLAEAHTALAMAIFYYDWNLPESDKEFRRAIELNPNYATAHHWYGSATLAVMKRFDEAIAEMKRAQELDPLSLVINVDLGYTYLYARQYDKAIEQLEKTVEMDQNFDLAHTTLCTVYAAKGLFPEAIAECRKVRQWNDDPYLVALLGHVYGASGKHGEALKIVEQMKEISKQQYVPAYNFAIVYATLGDKEQALNWLEKSYQDRANEMIFLQIDPLVDSLRDDPRFQELLRKVDFPQ